MPNLLILSLGLIFFILSCKTKNATQEEANNAPSANVVSEDLDRALFECKSAAEVGAFLGKHGLISKGYFPDFPGDSAQLVNQLFQILLNPDFQNFKTELDSLVPDRKANILDPLGKAFGRIKYYYPSFVIPKVQFMVTGFVGNDFYVSDSLIIIGLDYFGGPSAKYRPNVFDYQLSKYDKNYIIPSILFFESNQFNRMNSSDKSLLADMVSYGKGYEFVKRIAPETPDSLIVGYSEDNMKRTYNSQQDIWNYLVASKSLYETSNLKKRKFTEERPFTTEIGNQVPGAIGRWVGWRIVRRFVAEHPEVGLAELMNMDNAAAILQESGYSGQKDEED